MDKMQMQEVVLTIRGVQYDIDEEDILEMVVKAKYYTKNDIKYIIYKESGDDKGSNNMLKISENIVENIKKGSNNSHMIFKENKKTTTSYNTAQGSLKMGIDTSCIRQNQGEDLVEIEIDYKLEINYSYISKCNTKIIIEFQKN